MVKIRLLGQFSVELGGRAVDITARPAQSLFAYLLLNPVAHRRERLAGLLWPDSSEANARRNLRQALWQIRRALGEAADSLLLVEELTIGFNGESAYALDTERIAHPLNEETDADELMQIIALYTGELLPGFYDEWVLLERERLQAQFERKFTLLLERLVAERRWADVLQWGERWIALGYTPEPAYRALMQAHASLGDMVSMADVYRRCIEALDRELGVEPSPQTHALYEQLRVGEGLPTPLPLHSADANLFAGPSHNLPVQLTSFIGRKKELAELQRLLTPSADGRGGEEVRLLTLTGPGGTGKTRLALKAAHQLLDAFADGIWLVELAMIADAVLVPQTVAALLGVREEPNYPLTRALIAHLRAKTLLLLFDDCEHLVDPIAQLVETLLRACPQLKIMVTSRETLGVMGERTLRVPSLALPDVGPLPALDDLAQYEAIRLFVDRAVAVTPSFTLNEANAAAVNQICRQLDGVPLAIELAAARVRAMTPEQIAARLDDRFRLLTGGSRTALPRQQTLRAMIDWSWDLLSEPECTLLRRLAVFVGGWTLEAAEAVCADAPLPGDDVLELLTHLVEKSLVVMEEQAGAARYYLLETIRQYAREKLFEAGEAEAVRTRHLHFFLQIADEAEPQLRAAEQLTALARLDLEHDNLRAALKWASDNHALEAGLSLSGNLARYWYLRGYWKEGREWLRLFLEHPSSDPAATDALAHARARALAGAGWLADADGSEIPLYRESLALCRQVGDEWGEAYALRGLILISSNLTDLAHAEAHIEASLALFHKLEDAWGIGLAHFSLGWIDMNRDKIDEAAHHWEAAHDCFQESGDRWGISVALGALGYLARLGGRYPQAADLTNKSLALFRELGDKAGVSYSLIRLGNLAWRRGDFSEAMALLQESLKIQSDRNNQEGIIGALQGLAWIACCQGNYAQAHKLLRESGQLAQARAVPYEVGDNLSIQGWVYYWNNELDRANALLEESRTIFQRENETEGSAFSYYGLGAIALTRANYQQAEEHLQASLRLWQQRGDRHYTAAAHNLLGELALIQTDFATATVHYRNALTLYQEMVDKLGAATVLEGASNCVQPPAVGATLLGAAHALRQAIGAPLPPVVQSAYVAWKETLQTQLDDKGFAEQWATGEQLSYEGAVTLALAHL